MCVRTIYAYIYIEHGTTPHCNTLQHTATHCHTLQHTATHCNTLQRTKTHCNTLQHTSLARCVLTIYIHPLTEEIRLKIFGSPYFRSSHAHETLLFEILVTPVKACWKVTGTHWKLIWNFGGRNYFKSDLLRPWTHNVCTFMCVCCINEKRMFLVQDVRAHKKKFPFHMHMYVYALTSSFHMFSYTNMYICAGKRYNLFSYIYECAFRQSHVNLFPKCMALSRGYGVLLLNKHMALLRGSTSLLPKYMAVLRMIASTRETNHHSYVQCNQFLHIYEKSLSVTDHINLNRACLW